MSSCLSGGPGRTYSFDLDIVKPPPSSPPSRSSSSSPSSTISESSNSPITISTKRPRAPRKRPNQTYDEAAALLATLYPSVFSTNSSLRKFQKLPPRLHEFEEPQAELIPAFPAAAISDAAFLLRDPPPSPPPPPPAWSPRESKPLNFLKFNFDNPQSIDFIAPGAFEDDGFDAESILDEDVEEGLDSIIGEYSNGEKNVEESSLNPHLGSLMGLRLGGRAEFGFGLGGKANLRQALRRGDDWERRHSPTVAIRDIVPKFKKLSATGTTSKKKKKSKVVKVEKIVSKTASDAAIDATEEAPATTTTTSKSCEEESLNSKPNLGLKIDYEDIIKEWSDRQCPYADAPPESPESYAKLAEVELGLEGGNGVREASVQRYKEKRRTRLFSKKIRYQVRKVNADRRPRMKASGRFVRKPSLLHEAIEEESQ